MVKFNIGDSAQVKMIDKNTNAILFEKEFKMDLQDTYKCYLNGKFYGGGSLGYMHELFKDYVLTCKMYGKDECEFKIIKNK